MPKTAFMFTTYCGLLLSLCGCPEAPLPADGGDTTDAGAGTSDAGGTDGGDPDAGSPDAGVADAGGTDAGTSSDGGPPFGAWAPTCTPARPRCFSGLSCGLGGADGGESRWSSQGFDAFSRERTGLTLAAVRAADGAFRLLAAPRSTDAGRTFELRSFAVTNGMSPSSNPLITSAPSASATTASVVPTSTLVAGLVGGVPAAFSAGELAGTISVNRWGVGNTALTPGVSATVAGAGIPSLTLANLGTTQALLVSTTSAGAGQLVALDPASLQPLAGWSGLLGALSAPGAWRVASGDVDGDGLDEVLLCSGSGAPVLIITTPWNGTLVERTRFMQVVPGSTGCDVRVGNVLADQDGGVGLPELLVSAGPGAGVDAKVFIKDRCDVTRHVIWADYRHEQASWSFNGTGPAWRLPGDPNGLTLKQAFIGDGRHRGIELVSSIGGHYFSNSVIAVPDVNSSTPTATLPLDTRLISNQLGDWGWKQVLSYAPQGDFDFYVSVSYNQWSLPPNAPWTAPDPRVPGSMNVARFLSLDPDSFARLNDGVSWRAVMYPSFSPTTPSTPTAGTLFYWNLSTLETRSNGQVNWPARLRRQIHAGRMARVGTILRTWPHLIHYVSFGGELELPWGAGLGNRLADYGVFSLEEFRGWALQRYGGSLSALNTASGTSFAAATDITPPWGNGHGPSPGAVWNCIPLLDGCADHPWWRTWQAFRQQQVAKWIEDMALVARAEGIPPQLLVPHQIPGPAALSTSDNLRAGLTLAAADPPSGRLGLTTYGATCSDPGLLASATQSTVYWGSGEFNPWPGGPAPTTSAARATLETIWAAHPRHIAFHTFNSEFPLFEVANCTPSCSWLADAGVSTPESANNPRHETVTALREFMTTHKDVPRLGRGQGVSFVVADVDGDGLDDVLTNLGAAPDGLNESNVEIWSSLLNPLDLATLPSAP